MGITTPTSSEVAEEILLRGALSESSSWADCLNTIYGFGVTGQAVDSRPSGYPRWINATGMSINNGTSSGVTSNYTGAISSFGTLTAYGGDPLSSFTVYGEDDPSKVHTACYDHHVGIDKSVPPLGVQLSPSVMTKPLVVVAVTSESSSSISSPSSVATASVTSIPAPPV